MAIPDVNADFWLNLMTLKNELTAVDDTNHILLNNNSSIFTTHKSITREEMLTRIENVFESLLKDLVAGKPMKFSFNKRGVSNNIWFNRRVGLQMEDNVQMTVVSMENESSLKKFAVMLRVLSHCYQLLQSNNYTTKRDVYYADKVLFGTQQAVDEVFNDLACMLQVPRSSLHVFASPKGCVKGNLTFKDEDGSLVDCSLGKMGIMVPAHVDGVHDMYSNAKYVLLVEKEASFQKLNDDGLLAKLGPCIMITAKGFPDINTRIFLKKIWENLRIPILALVDADPHGIEIMCVYRFGSKLLQGAKSVDPYLEAAQWLKEKGKVYPSLLKAYQLALTIPVSVASNERSFSKLKLVKTYLRSTMKEARLDSLMLAACSNDILDSLNLDVIADSWSKLKTRKAKI